MARDFHYKMESTSSLTSKIEDIELSVSEKGLTRKVIRAQIIKNPKAKENTVKIAIVHQRRASPDMPWEDLGGSTLRDLQAGKAKKMQFDTAETRLLFGALANLYEIGKGGIRPGRTLFEFANQDEIIRTDASRTRIIRKLLTENGKGIWDALAGDPDLATKLAYAKIYEDRQDALKEFKEHLEKKDWGEKEWQQFFEKNSWIFGYGLILKWIAPVGEKFEQTTTGYSIFKTGKRPDAFTKVSAEVATTVFGDTKTPETPLLKSSQYRPGVYSVSPDVTEGVSQIQITIQDWVDSGKFRFETKDKKGFDDQTLFSVQPKGVLIIGSLEQFRNGEGFNEDMIKSFELYRRNTANPEIITFDELYERARFILDNTSGEEQISNVQEVPVNAKELESDIPF